MPKDAAPISKLTNIHPSLIDAIVQRAVDEPLRPYFDALRGKSLADSVMAGLIHPCRPEDGGGGRRMTVRHCSSGSSFPCESNGRHSGLAAWEAVTGSGRATYFFRTGQSGDGNRRSMSKPRCGSLRRDSAQ